MDYKLTAELRNSIVWLERQPGVSNVVQGRYTRTRHKRKAGFARIQEQDARHVRVQVFDAKGTKDLFVYAEKTGQRDKWVAALAGGNVIETLIGKNGSSPKAEKSAATVAAAAAARENPALIHTPVFAPKPVDAEAGQLFLVTPDLAFKWLERNTRNRPLRNDVVLRYASDMKAGRWLRTGDAIGFDRNGAIVNGQHRLWAVTEANVPVPMLVTFDLDPEVVNVLDDHLKRKLTDVARISRPGMAITNKHAGIARMLMVTSIATTSQDKRASVAKISRQAQLAFMDKHMAAIEFAYRDVFRSSNDRGITTIGVQTPVARAFYTQDKERLLRFGKVLLTGIQEEGAHDAPAIILRNLILRLEASAMRAASEIIYRKTERALSAFLNRERIKTLYEASEELFPLPEEQKAHGRR